VTISPDTELSDREYSPKMPPTLQICHRFPAILAQLYPQSGGPSIDGVLAIDPYGLAALLNFTGPIDVPGLAEPLTSANAAQVLLTQQYISFNRRLLAPGCRSPRLSSELPPSGL